MASPLDIDALRQLINDTAVPYEFDPTFLSAQIDAAGDVRTAAGVVWGIKASRLAGLVDVTEGSSSRKMSQLYKQALEMATHYGGSTDSGGGTVASRRSGTRPIVRPT